MSLIYGCMPSMAFIFLATSASGCPSSSLLRILAVKDFWRVATASSTSMAWLHLKHFGGAHPKDFGGAHPKDFDGDIFDQKWKNGSLRD